MTPILDLGGAPANEPCAQLGQTCDFDFFNRLEVAAYEAALKARYGAPPPGCRFVPIDHDHDFGRYRTLGLASDDPDDGAVRSFREAVEQGLGRWTEAGFAPPVTYQGSTAHALRRDASAIVVGALGTTRPDWQGRFPLEDFATLHRNLRSAYPAEAATYDALHLSPAPEQPIPPDPRFCDDGGAPLVGTALARAVCRAAIAAVVPHLEAAGIARVMIDYDGGGDEGQINDVRPEAEDGAGIDLPAVACERFRTGFDGHVSVDVTSLDLALEEIGNEALAAYHAGWEDNNGAFGTVTIDAAKREATLDHNIYVSSSELFTTAL